jgi:hypothetical protein
MVERTFKFGPRTFICALVPPLEWKKNKTALVPWVFFDNFTFTKADTEAAKELQFEGVWGCKLCGYDYFFAQTEDVTISKEVPKKMTQHLHREDHLKLWLTKTDENRTEDQKGATAKDCAQTSELASQQAGFVRAVLQSGLSYSQFTRKGPIYGLLRDHGVPVVSHPVFQRFAVEMANHACEMITKAVESQMITMSYDSSPALDRRNFITINAHFIDSSGGYVKLNLGVVMIDGICDGNEYAQFLKEYLAVYNLDIFNWTTGKAIPSGLKRGIVMAGVSDMGPGLFQATEKLTGTETRGSCCAHGQSNIINASVLASSEFNDAYDQGVLLLKKIRGDREIRLALLRQKLTIPKNGAKERWNRSGSATEYLVRNFENLAKVEELQGVELDNTRLVLPILSESRKLSEIMDRSNTFVQYQGAMDALVIPFHFLSVIAHLNSVNVSSALMPMKTLLVNRLTRRLFDGELNDIECSFGDDRTRKGNLFKNLFVLAAWAISPDFNFTILQQYRFKNADQARVMTGLAEAALLKIHKVVDPQFFASQETASSNGFRHFVFGSSEGDTPQDRHAKERDGFRNDGRIKRAFECFSKDMYAKPSESRQSLLATYVDVAKERDCPGWIFKVIRLIFGYPLTTVDCERDFSWLQLLLDEHRLRMSNEILAAYIIAKKSPSFMKLPPGNKGNLESRDAFKMLMNSGAKTTKRAKLDKSVHIKQTATTVEGSRPSTAHRVEAPSGSSNACVAPGASVNHPLSLLQEVETGEQTSNAANQQIPLSDVHHIIEAVEEQGPSVSSVVILDESDGEVEKAELDSCTEHENSTGPRRSRRIKRVPPRFALFFQKREGDYASAQERLAQLADFEGIEFDKTSPVVCSGLEDEEEIDDLFDPDN